MLLTNVDMAEKHIRIGVSRNIHWPPTINQAVSFYTSAQSLIDGQRDNDVCHLTHIDTEEMFSLVVCVLALLNRHQFTI